MDCSPPGSPVQGISQSRILEWVAISFSRGSYRPRDQTRASCIAGRFFTTEPAGKPITYSRWLKFTIKENTASLFQDCFSIVFNSLPWYGFFQAPIPNKTRPFGSRDVGPHALPCIPRNRVVWGEMEDPPIAETPELPTILTEVPK